jgi:Glycosyltransferase Family 4
MRFVLGNRHLLAAGGTEVHIVTVAEHLQRLGHEVLVYAPELGPFADHARRRGLEIRDSLRELPASCDVTFSQDAIVVYDLAERYPDALSVFRICGDVADYQLPPQLTAVVDLIVVLSDRYERIARACADRVPVLRLPVPIDVDRLVPLGAVRERPERAVMLGNYLERDALLSDVWGRLGIEVQRIGGHVQAYDVATAVADADIVVAKSRAALDAMACGRPVYVFDVFGGDGWVTPELYPALEADNFAGLATGRVIDAATLAGDLSAYRPEMGTVNRDLALQHHNARDHVVALLDAIEDHEPQKRSPAPLRELARLTAMQWSWELTAREFRSMHWPLREHAAASEHRSAEAAEAARQAARERDDALAAGRQLAAERDEAAARARRLEAQLADGALRDEIDRLQTELDAMRATRAWKLATALWRIKRRLRRSGRARP